MMLSCPRCRADLHSTDQCENCKLEFSKDGDTPILLDPLFNKVVQFKFDSQQTQNNEKILEEYMNEPPVAQLTEKIPYHLDPAHMKIIDELPANQKILEIGCGGGQARQWFTAKGHQYVGIDISKVRVFEWLQQFGGPDILCDAHCLPFGDRQFDLVYSAAATEHFACPYLVVQEVARVLKPGGYYLGNVSFLEPWHDHSFFHMSPLGVFQLLTQANLQIKYIWPEWGYSGYQALFAMGNRFTNSISFIGEAAYTFYRLENHLKKFVKGLLKHSSISDIHERAKVAGAIFWIAVRPRD